jgi:hypothetical protein
MSSQIIQLQRQIQQIKSQLQDLGPMRPGSLTRQYHDPKRKRGGFYQLSYTYRMQSQTEYARPTFIPQLKKEIANFKRFKALTQKWVDLALQLSKLQIEIAKKSLPN